MKLSNREITQGLKTQDKKVLLYIYENFFPYIESMVLGYRGNHEDAKDLFQECLLIIYQQLKKGSLIIKSDFFSYLKAIAKYLWQKEIKRRNIELSLPLESDDIFASEDNFESAYLEMERKKLLLSFFRELNSECRQIIRLIIRGNSLEEVTGIMGYSSIQYTSNRRYKCKLNLIKKIWASPKYHELKNGPQPEDHKVPRW
jgi:RNA polymerase sigma factor (sigma-70 family)